MGYVQYYIRSQRESFSGAQTDLASVLINGGQYLLHVRVMYSHMIKVYIHEYRQMKFWK